jgi:photosystem II stability/assembly factor-like uncharacterized protein
LLSEQPGPLAGLTWRNLGPFRGGRVTAVAGDPGDPLCFYFGACAGGVWKTTDGGLYWRNVSDGFFQSASVGALAVASSDPQVIYVGMGEACIRENVLHGDGVYRSTDGGRTWTHCGLADTRHIARIRVHPNNPDLVYVGALGHAFGPNGERGVFRSIDGGRHWERVLFVDELSGVIDLAMDPLNPRILYAATYQTRRTPYSLEAGGPGSRLFKTQDGGDTWTEVTGNPGIPEGVKGRMGVAVAPKSGRVYLSLEMAGAAGGMYRTDDGGTTWRQLTDNPELRQRPWYFSHIFADPVDADTLYVLNFEAWRSIDGGRTYEKLPAGHVDHHDLWIDPHNPRRLINGHDGGAAVSYDGGATWSNLMNQPTAQFYHVTTDTRWPYRVYGAQQDNSTLAVPSRTDSAAITLSQCYAVGGGESGYIAVRPDDPDIVYAGSYNLLTRYNHRSGEVRNITPWPADVSGAGAQDARYRFQWTSPMFISPHDPKVLYHAANVVFRSTDEGQSWEVISPDLTRDDKQKQESSGGPVTKDNTSAEFYCTIFALAESPVTAGVLWAGSDDGLVHLSRDGGRTWTNVTPAALPEWALIAIIEPSHSDPATAYLAATCYKSDRLEPWLLRTRDWGQSWQVITHGIPADEPTRVVREDPDRPGLLFCGTLRGVYVSWDGGEEWQPLRLNLPVVPVWDMAFHEASLVLATHGRGFWVMDDVTPLRHLEAWNRQDPAHLFPLAPVVRMRGGGERGRADMPAGVFSADNVLVGFERVAGPHGETVRRLLNAGDNPPGGAVLTYWLRDAAEGEVRLTITDAAGDVVRQLTSRPPDPVPGTPPAPKLGATAGSHQVVWDLRYADAVAMPAAVYRGGGIRGPLVPPGRYRATLEVGDQTYTTEVLVFKDPRLEADDGDLQAQTRLLLRIRDQISAAHQAVFRIRRAREAVAFYQNACPADRRADLEEVAQPLLERLRAVEETLYQTKAVSAKDLLNVPGKLNARLASLAGAVGMGQHRPTRQMEAVHAELSAQLDGALADLQRVWAQEGTRFNEVVAALHLPAVSGA